MTYDGFYIFDLRAVFCDEIVSDGNVNHLVYVKIA